MHRWADSRLESWLSKADLISLVPIIQKVSQVPVLIATAHKTHEQTGEIMGLALEFKRSLEPAGSPTNSPLFLLAHQEPNARISTDSLQRMLTQLPRPLDLWMVNYPPQLSQAQTVLTPSTGQEKWL